MRDALSASQFLCQEVGHTGYHIEDQTPRKAKCNVLALVAGQRRTRALMEAIFKQMISAEVFE